MTSEELEFQISQYVDGMLSTSDGQIVDEILLADPSARKILLEYQQLNTQLSRLQNGPAVQWDRFAEIISAAIDDDIDNDRAPLVAGRIGFLQARWRIAAGLLLACTAALIGRHAMRPHPQQMAPAVVTETASAVVVGPQVELPAGTPVQDVSVGPSATLTMRNPDWRYGEGVVGRGPSKITILGSLNPPVHHDSDRH